MTLQRIKLFGLVLCALVFTGCAGVKSFPNTVQTGETVAIAAGWKKHFSRNDIQVTFTPASGPEVVYTSPDPRIQLLAQLNKLSHITNCNIEVDSGSRKGTRKVAEQGRSAI